MEREFSLELQAGAEGFGAGDHPTTHMALQAMHALAEARQVERILDMGCGAGLLAMTAAHLWPQAHIWAADIESSAVRMAERNIVHNGLAGRITALRSDGYKHPVLQEAAPFDLILCNITADPILGMAKQAAQLLAEDGMLVLSGILRWRSEEVLQIHAQHGLHPLTAPLGMESWDTHLLGKAASSA